MSPSVEPTEKSISQVRIHPIRDACLFASLPFFFGLVTVLLLYELAREAQVEAVRVELRQLARTAADAVDGDLHRSLRSSSQEGSLEHARTLEPLVRLHRLWKDVIYVYTVVSDGERVFFVLDTAKVYRTPGNELPFDPLFTEYKGKDPELREALRTHTEQVNRNPVVEKHRTYLSAFAPFRDRAGAVVGIVGVDLTLDDVQVRLTGVRRAAWATLGVLAMLSAMLGGIIYQWRTKASRALLQEQADARLLGQARIAAEGLARQAADANLAKSEFLANMSHELRTPLNAILGFGQIIQLEEPPESSAYQYANEIVDAGNHLLKLVNDLIEIGRIESRRLELHMESVWLKGLVRECLTLVAGATTEREIITRIAETPELDAHIEVDRIRFKQVVLNLLSNAIKYNKPGGTVEVRCAASDERRVRVSISDTGAGLADAQIARLFTAFERLGAENSTILGAGLGLVITKRLVEAMGGTIGVDSVVGKGSTFWVEMSRSDKSPH